MHQIPFTLAHSEIMVLLWFRYFSLLSSIILSQFLLLTFFSLLAQRRKYSQEQIREG